MIFDILKTKIESAGLALEGETLFFDYMPADVKIGVGLYNPLDGIPIDPFIPGHHKTDFKVIVRHHDPIAGEKLAMTIMHTLTIEGEEVYEATEEHGRLVLKIFYPETYPIRFPSLEGNGIEWSTNFRLAFSVESL